jgi:hypothetical protein
MRSNRVGHGPTFHDQIDPAPQWHVAVMSGRQMIEQFHPKQRHGFVINIDTVALRKFLERLPHPHGRVIDRGFSQISQSHRDVGAVVELRRQNRRLLEGAHQFAHFPVVCKIANLRFQHYPAGANRVQRKRTTTAPMTDMMNPAG